MIMSLSKEQMKKLRQVITENLRIQKAGAKPVQYIDVHNALNDICQALSSRNAGLIADKLTDRIENNIPDLCEQIDTFIEQLDKTKREDVISNLCDIFVPESALRDEDLRSVLCLTMHGSKGLTKKTVVMPGLEDSWLPGNASENDMHEKKRLFYVAITRATNQVLITYPKTRQKGDPLNYPIHGRSQPSRFISQSGIFE